jgi:hypothetical protein
VAGVIPLVVGDLRRVDGNGHQKHPKAALGMLKVAQALHVDSGTVQRVKHEMAAVPQL